jgi:hypothetical protein
MSHDYEGAGPSYGRPSLDPRATGYGDREPERFRHEPPDDRPKDLRCRLCKDRGVYMGAVTGWKVAPCPKCCADEEKRSA